MRERVTSEDFVDRAVAMDAFIRRVRGWELGRGLDQGLTLAASVGSWTTWTR